METTVDFGMAAAVVWIEFGSVDARIFYRILLSVNFGSKSHFKAFKEKANLVLRLLAQFKWLSYTFGVPKKTGLKTLPKKLPWVANKMHWIGIFAQKSVCKQG